MHAVWEKGRGTDGGTTKRDGYRGGEGENKKEDPLQKDRHQFCQDQRTGKHGKQHQFLTGEETKELRVDLDWKLVFPEIVDTT